MTPATRVAGTPACTCSAGASDGGSKPPRAGRKPRCSICHRLLTDPYSIAVMMGPECRGEYKQRGGRLPQPKWKVIHGRVIYTGLVPAVNTTQAEGETEEE